MEPLVEGIKVGKTRVKLSPFADDTALGLGNTAEIDPALRAIKYWCDATGMRENTKKREGLAMGKYRYKRLRWGIKWCKVPWGLDTIPCCVLIVTMVGMAMAIVP